jgi:hypothetical protein
MNNEPSPMEMRLLTLLQKVRDERDAEAHMELNGLLRADSDARKTMAASLVNEQAIISHLRDESIVSILNPEPMSVLPSKSTRGLQRSPLWAAAAGIVFGVLCTSVVFGYAISSAGNTLTLLHESFESGPAPLVMGVPIELGAWSGDYSEIVEAWPSLRPVDGKRMLRFLRADYPGKEKQVGYFGDLYRVIDLRGDVSQFADGNAVVSVEAAFASLALEESSRFSPHLLLHALEKLPANAEAWHAMIETPRRLEEASLASASRQEFFLSSDPWRHMSLEMRLPPRTRYLLVGLHIGDMEAARYSGGLPSDVEFDGQFVDDVRVKLHRHWALYQKTTDTLGQGKKL